MAKDTNKKPVTDAAKRALVKYEQKFHKCMLRIPLDLDEKLTERLKQGDVSMNGYILDLIEKDLNRK